MRVLIISYYFFPINTPRAFRWNSIAEFWKAQGHSVDVVSVKKPGLAEEETLKGVQIFRVGYLAGMVEALRVKTRMSSQEAKEGPRASSFSFCDQLRQGLTLLAKWLSDQTWRKLHWPDYTCLWYLPASKIVKHLLSQRSYDAMITVSHPFSGHVVGYSIKIENPTIKWIVDIGDPFCFLDDPPNNLLLYGDLNQSFEEKVFNKADVATVTTAQTLRKYADLFPANTGKMHVIPPLFSLPSDQPYKGLVFPCDDKIRLVFVGRLYHIIRTPDFLLKLYKQLLDTSLGEKLELHLFGDLHGCENTFFPYQTLLGEKIFLHGWVSRSKAFQAMKEATILVNIGNESTYQLPSKVVEYAAMNKFILNLVKTSEDSSMDFFHSCPAALSVLDSGTSLEINQIEIVCQFIERASMETAPANQSWLSSYTIEKISKAYEALI